MKNLITAIALAASLAIGVQANAQQTRMVIQEPAVQPYINPGHGQSCSCTRLGFYGQFIPGYGIRINSVIPHSKAADLGLEQGDVLKRVNGVKITSEWQYRNLLRNAVQYNHGHVNLLVRNVRWDWGYNVPKFVTVHAYLDCGPYGQPFGQPYGQQYGGHQH